MVMTNIDTLSPGTIEGMKRLAQEIKKRDGVKHMKALDLVAQRSGYKNFNDARRKLVTEGDGQ
jgi:hypothetical protein